MICEFSEWVVEGAAPGLPRSLVAPPCDLDGMDPEAALLLPVSPGTGDRVAGLRLAEGQGVAAFLADPNLTVARLARDLRAAGAGWVANFPSVGQHEVAFRRLLAEVDLDYAREMRVLEALRDAGLSTLATVCRADDADAAEAAGASALFALPPVPAYANGLPALDRRRALEAAVAARTSLPVLGLRDGDEPAGPGAVLRRPAPDRRRLAVP